MESLVDERRMTGFVSLLLVLPVFVHYQDSSWAPDMVGIPRTEWGFCMGEDPHETC